MMPTFSVIMPTLNSERTIRRSLESLAAQSFPREKIEVLVVDGGSSDATLAIAAEFGCRVVPNPRVQPECAKHEGLLAARGEFALFLDSDEVLEERDALEKRATIFVNQPGVHFIMTGGYRKPADAAGVNDYINLFSDPFSYFMYRVSSDSRFYFSTLRQVYGMESVNPSYGILKFSENSVLPLADLSAGNTLRLDVLRRDFSAELTSVDIVPLAFLLLARSTSRVAVLRHDPVVHHAADTFGRYLHKLKWRVVVNLHFVHQGKVGVGFSTRERKQPLGFRLRKFLFIPYALLFLPALWDSAQVWLRSRSAWAWAHPFLSIYVAIQIVWHVVRKRLGYVPQLRPYGAKQG